MFFKTSVFTALEEKRRIFEELKDIFFEYKEYINVINLTILIDKICDNTIMDRAALIQYLKDYIVIDMSLIKIEKLDEPNFIQFKSEVDIQKEYEELGK